jgi:hypothetical protein
MMPSAAVHFCFHFVQGHREKEEEEDTFFVLEKLMIFLGVKI